MKKYKLKGQQLKLKDKASVKQVALMRAICAIQLAYHKAFFVPQELQLESLNWCSDGEEYYGCFVHEKYMCEDQKERRWSMFFTGKDAEDLKKNIYELLAFAFEKELQDAEITGILTTAERQGGVSSS